KQRRMAARTYFRVTEFTHTAILDLAAQLGCHRLHAIADAEHRHAQFKYRLWHARRVPLDYRAGTTRQNDASSAVAAHELIRHIGRKYLGKYAGFAHTARNQLGDLGAEIENENFGVHDLKTVNKQAAPALQP